MVLCQVGSFIGGNLSVIGLMLVAMPLADFALKFGSPENFSLIFFALIVATSLVSESLVRGLIGLIIGLIVSVIGYDVQTGIPRLTMGTDALLDGIDNVVVIIGIFGIGEVLWYTASTDERAEGAKERLGAGRWIPNREEWRAGWWPMIRGSVIGFLAGVLAAGPSLGSFLSYSVEKRISKHPETFGKGALEGITACESANNATTGGTLIPLFTLGIPHTGSLAILMAVMIMYGLRPGPMLMTQQAPLMWTIIASLYIGNVILLIMNLPAVGLFVKILDIPMKYLMPMIIVLATVGTYSLNQSWTDVALTVAFGVIGFALRWGGFTPIGMVLGMVLGDKLEHYLRSAILISHYDLTVFFTKPISLFFLVLTAVILAVDIVARRKGRAADDSEG
jgi:putative tricarboxylic transport membrane protein